MTRRHQAPVKIEFETHCSDRILQKSRCPEAIADKAGWRCVTALESGRTLAQISHCRFEAKIQAKTDTAITMILLPNNLASACSSPRYRSLCRAKCTSSRSQKCSGIPRHFAAPCELDTISCSTLAFEPPTLPLPVSSASCLCWVSVQLHQTIYKALGHFRSLPCVTDTCVTTKHFSRLRARMFEPSLAPLVDIDDRCLDQSQADPTRI